jgi:hypothetical protein
MIKKNTLLGFLLFNAFVNASLLMYAFSSFVLGIVWCLFWSAASYFIYTKIETNSSTKKIQKKSLATQFFENFPRRPMYEIDFIILNRLREQDKINSKKNQS